MALGTSTPLIPRSPIRYPDVDMSGLNLGGGGSSEIVELSPSPSTATPARVSDDTLYVAVGKEVKESEYTIAWALHNSGGRRLCILHVHTPAQKIPMMGTKFSIDQLEEHQVKAYHDKERQDTYKILDKYLLICGRAGAQVDRLYIETDSIEKGIVDLISKHGIRKLVMGAAANKCYSKRMTEVKSKKAIYVREQAPPFCQIRFICKGNLIYTRESRLEGINSAIASPPLNTSPAGDTGQLSSLRRSATEGHTNEVNLVGSLPEFRRVQSDSIGINLSGLPSSTGTGRVSFSNSSNVEGSTDGWNGIPRRSFSVASHFSSCSSGDMGDDSPSISLSRSEGRDNVLDSYALYDHRHTSPPSTAVGSVDDELYDRLEQYVAEAENSRREAFGESQKRMKAEKEAIEARRRANASETMYAEEFRRRSAIEEALARSKDEVEQMKRQINEVMEDLQAAQEQKSSLESQIANSDKMVQELEQKIFSAVELLQKYKKEREELEVERDNALKVVEDMKRKLDKEASSSSTTQFFAEFSFSEIEEATSDFDPNLKIGEGGYGSIYRGVLRQTPVAIKILHPDSSQGPSEFQQEVNILSKLRHPNLVTLIGACPESFTLVYEYLPNGSLEDRISCKGNTPPLTWQTRIRIATELCSALIFLHSCNGQGIVHGDLKPANILLDLNFVSKLSDFGICRVLSQNEFSDNNTSLCWITDPKGTFVYMDPEFLSTGELTPKSDVYSFGIILLRLLTGKPALGITREVQYALDKGNLKDLLDPTAGDWPFVQAKQLAHLAMSCCEMNRRQRPDLASEVWKVLEPMRASCGASSSFQLSSEERCQIPHYFICPIFQEIMEDPVVAADGFTYEAEALRGWLDSGHDTSPMTNLQLSHTNLVANRALRSAIQEWLQQH
nr:U-box domain-containing protein 33 [Ipomoea batatas]